MRALQRCPTMPAVCSLSFPSLPLLELRADISGSPERGQDAQNNSFHGRRKMSLAELGAKQRARRTRAAPCRSRAPRGWALLAGFCCGWKRALAWLESSGCSAFFKCVCNVGSKRVLHCFGGTKLVASPRRCFYLCRGSLPARVTQVAPEIFPYTFITHFPLTGGEFFHFPKSTHSPCQKPLPPFPLQGWVCPTPVTKSPYPPL